MITQRLSRRDFFCSSVNAVTLLLGPSLVGARRGSGATRGSQSPHYLLELVYRPGWDPSYLCDSRPLSMTAAGRIQNYWSKGPEDAPEVLIGANSGRTLVTPLFAPVRPYFDRGQLSVLNGVHMATGFDGHEQNLNFLFTGNPFGGECLLPHLNAGTAANPIDFLQVGEFFGAQFENTSAALNITPRAAKDLSNAVRGLSGYDPQSPLFRYVGARFDALGPGTGALAVGAQEFGRGFRQSPDLAQRLARVNMGEVPDGDAGASLPYVLRMVHEFFASNVARGAAVELDQELDTHDAGSAKQQPEKYRRIGNEIAAVFDYLTTQEFLPGSGQKLIDVTTVVITSEFGRTMRQGSRPIDDTGTDHNPLSNTVFIGGKGIRGGLVVGASDQAHETAQVSAAHKSLDEGVVKVMGKVFDFGTLLPKDDLPSIYDPRDYLTYASIANTIYDLFGVPGDVPRWTLGRNLPIAQSLPGLKL